MLQGKNGRFVKTNNIEFNLPTPYSIIKYSILLFVLLPWIYLTIFKFNIISVLENSFETLFGPHECSCPNQQKEY